jgi:hypothetical protein
MVGGGPMRLRIVHDEQGNILAATTAGEDADEFVVQDGERVGEFDVDDESAEVGLARLLENLRVETESERLVQR